MITPAKAAPLDEMTTELVERIEVATGPSDELDLEIAEWCYANGAVAGVNYDPKLWMIRHGGEFTRSIDAAMTLVPEGWMRIFGDDPDSGKAVAGLYKDDEDDAKSIAETIPLAICAAALRARKPSEVTP